MIIIGGLGSVSGSIYRAAFLTLLPAIFNNMSRSLREIVPAIIAIMTFVQQGIFGLIIILFFTFEPENLAKI